MKIARALWTAIAAISGAWWAWLFLSWANIAANNINGGPYWPWNFFVIF